MLEVKTNTITKEEYNYSSYHSMLKPLFQPNNMPPQGHNKFYRKDFDVFFIRKNILGGPTNDAPQDVNSELLNSSQKIINYHLSNDPKAKQAGNVTQGNNVEHSYRIKQLAELVHYTPTLKLKVFEIFFISL